MDHKSQLKLPNRNDRAVGLEYIPNPQIHPDAPAEATSVYAKKLVVLSGGAWGSPAILERSGIGSSTILEKFGIKQVVDLPGVGERYQGNAIGPLLLENRSDRKVV